MILAEELAVLAIQPDGTWSRGGANRSAHSIAMTGALVVDLERGGHLELDDDFTIGLTGRRPVHPALAAEVDRLAPLEGRRLGASLVAVRHAGWIEVVDGLIASGVLRLEKRLLRRPRYPHTELSPRERLLADVRAAAFGRDPLDDRMAALLALADLGKLIEVISPHQAQWPGVRRRMREAAERVPVAELFDYATEARLRDAVVDGPG